MLVGSLGSWNFVPATRRSGFQAPANHTPSFGKAAAARVGVRDFMSRLVKTGESVKALQADFGSVHAGTTRVQKARTTGLNQVSIATRATASTLTSAEEISTKSKTIVDRTPEWSTPGASGTPIITGEYTGLTDATYELRYSGSNPHTIGDPSRAGRVSFFKNGVSIGAANMPKNFAGGTFNLDLAAGLTVTFHKGDIIGARGVATVEALTNVDVVSDPDAAFDGSDNGTHNLDSAVTAGSFEINGSTIQVEADDTIRSVIRTINSSGAGVSAAYDGSTDTVTLTHQTPGAETISVGSDTSGFLAAVKLDTATTTAGDVDEREVAMAGVAELAGISSGSFQINGVSIFLDPSTDTLSDLITRVGDSAAGATLSYSASNGKLSIRSATSGAELTVENDTTGLFSTFGVAEGTTEAKTTRGMSQHLIREMVDQVAEMVDFINQMTFVVDNESLINDGAKTARNQVRAAIQEGFSTSGDTIRTRFGLTFHVGADSTQSFIELGKNGERALHRALEQRPTEVLPMLFGSRNQAGLLTNTLNGLDAAQDTLTGRYGSVGMLLNVAA